MKGMRRLIAGLLVAVMLASGLGMATLEAAKPGGGGGGQEAICAYLQAIIDYPYTHPYILSWALALYNKLGCGG